MAQSRSSSIADLWRVAETNDIRALEHILSTGIDVNTSNEHGTTALMRAVSRGRLRMVEALIARGADPNAVRNDDFTPLTLAAFFGHAEIVKLLVQAGAETERATRYSTSARMWASARTFEAVAKYLDKVPPPSPVDTSGSVALEHAVEPIQKPGGNLSPESNLYPIRKKEPDTLDEEVSFEHVDDGPPYTDSSEIEDAFWDVPKDLLPHPMLSARVRSAAMGVGLAAFIGLMSLAAISIVSWSKSRNDKQKVQVVGNAVQPRAVSEQPVANVALTTPDDSEKRVEEEPVEKKVNKQPLRPQHSAQNSRRTDKTKFVDDNENEATPKLKPAQKSDSAFAVSNQAPANKGISSPLSTQLVSSPSKSSTKPKVIQWP